MGLRASSLFQTAAVTSIMSRADTLPLPLLCASSSSRSQTEGNISGGKPNFRHMLRLTGSNISLSTMTSSRS